jgi:hypothetical protein
METVPEWGQAELTRMQAHKKWISRAYWGTSAIALPIVLNPDLWWFAFIMLFFGTFAGIFHFNNWYSLKLLRKALQETDIIRWTMPGEEYDRKFKGYLQSEISFWTSPWSIGLLVLLGGGWFILREFNETGSLVAAEYEGPLQIFLLCLAGVLAITITFFRIRLSLAEQRSQAMQGKTRQIVFTKLGVMNDDIFYPTVGLGMYYTLKVDTEGEYIKFDSENGHFIIPLPAAHKEEFATLQYLYNGNGWDERQKMKPETN